MTFNKYNIFYLAYDIAPGVYLTQTQLPVKHRHFVAMIIFLNGTSTVWEK
jgi:hypothetical protein